MSDLVVIAFPSEEKAEEVRQKLLSMQKDDWPRDRTRHLAIDTLVVLFMLWRAAR